MVTEPGDDEGEATAAGRIVAGTRPAVDSASVLLLRDAASTGRRDAPCERRARSASPEPAVEVFMLERHIETDFAGGALVFPGGKVDGPDRDLEPARWRGVALEAMAETLGVATPAAVLGLYVAAVRETFEEAGVLLGTRGAQPIVADDLASPSFLAARARLADRGSDWDWRRWLTDEAIVLDLGALTPWSWWVTPHGMHRRYDTRFFVTCVPAVQAPALRHDDIETVSSRWTTAAAALAAHAAGAVTLVYPTRQNLRQLAAHSSVDGACAASAGRVAGLRRLMPVVVHVDGRAMVAHPDGGPPERP